MHDSFETKDEVVVVMELAEGELFQVLEGMDIKIHSQVAVHVYRCKPTESHALKISNLKMIKALMKK